MRFLLTKFAKISASIKISLKNQGINNKKKINYKEKISKNKDLLSLLLILFLLFLFFIFFINYPAEKYLNDTIYTLSKKLAN
jgi:hypothetical protein